METLQAIPFIVAAVLALTGVLCEHFNDNLLQRCGMATVCVSGTAAAWRVIVHSDTHCVNSNAMQLLAYGVALYGIGTALKVAKYRWHTHSQNKTS